MCTGASGDSSPSHAFPRRGIRWIPTFSRFSKQGHQVTPHLRMLFCAGGWGDSFAPRGPHITLNEWERSPLHTVMWGWYHVNERLPSTHGSRWCGAGIMWMRGYPLPMTAADVGLVSCEWEVTLYTRQPLMWGWNHVNESVPLHMAAADVGLASCEWECPSTHDCRWCGAGIMWMRVSLYTWQPLMWGWNHVNQRLSSTHGRPLLGGWYRVNKRAVSSRHGSHWWGAGIVWMSEEPSDCNLHMAERCSEAGGCKLRQWVCPCGICGDMRTHSSCICPRFSAPPWKGNVRSRADVLSSRFDGWEECGHSRHKLITRVLKVHHWSRADGLILKKKSYSPERCRGAAIQACPRMSEPQLWAVIV